MVQAVDRAVRILQICSRGPVSIEVLSDKLGVHRTTVLRILQSLEAGGLVRRDSERRFVIGYGAYSLTAANPSAVDLRSVVGPHLRRLAEDLGFSVHCAVPVDDRIISLDFVEPPYSIRLPLRVGGNVVIHTAGVAKAILAHLEPAHCERILANATWERFTERTITDPDIMRGVMESVRERGWAYDDGEFEEVSNCVAGPFFDFEGRVIGAVSLTAFKAQNPLSSLKAALPRLKEELDAMSSEFGRQATTEWLMQ